MFNCCQIQKEDFIKFEDTCMRVHAPLYMRTNNYCYTRTVDVASQALQENNKVKYRVIPIMVLSFSKKKIHPKYPKEISNRFEVMR